MTFEEIVAQVRNQLRREGRIAYRIIKRRFGLSDDDLEDLKADLIDAKRVAIDEEGKVLVWVNEAQKASGISFQAEQANVTETLDGERKTVTALFADIKGSMELIEDLDPEEARAIVDPALKLMIEAVQHFGGYIVQSTGDGIFALFGAPVAHEDHPQRALFAALRMQDEIRRYGDGMRARGHAPIQVRIGANTGEVVVRSLRTGVGHSEYTPIGHSTSLAARLQAIATPGSTVISGYTRVFVEGYFQLKALGPTRIKGVSEAVELFEVTGLGPLRTRLQRAAGRGLTRFIGREREMEELRHAAELAKDGHGQLVTVMAEPGVGKSRLFHEFKIIEGGAGGASMAGRDACPTNWMVLVAFSVSHGKDSAYLPVIEMLHSYFGIDANDDGRRRREKVNDRIVTLNPALEDIRPYLFGLLGLAEGDDPLAQMDSQVKKRRTMEAIKRILLHESINQPLMVIFEDLHWIDEQTQELLNLLADSLATVRILLLVNYRPEYRHDWGNKTYYTQLRLDPLGRDTAQEMLGVLLGRNAELSPLKSLIIDRTEGNPFFMEEIVQGMLEEGILLRNGGIKLTQPMNAIRIPATVQAMLAARIDRLAPQDRDLLQTLAVLGKEFSLSQLKAVVTNSDSELDRRLAILQSAEFIYEQPVANDIEYTFKHALTQEVAYNSILIERRKLLHEHAAQVLESMYSEQLEDHLCELVRHYSRSNNIEKAVEYLARAGQQAMQRSAHAEAVSNLTGAIDLLQRLPHTAERLQQELALQLTVGPAHIVLSGWGSPQAERAYARVRELSDQVGDAPELFPGLFGLWAIYNARAKIRISYPMAQQLLRRAQNVNDDARLIYANLAMGNASFDRGDLPIAQKYLDQALSVYDRERHHPLAAHYGGLDAGVWVLFLTSRVLWELGYPDQAIRRSNQMLALEFVK
jgi:class 3 adenylate cyclase/tetratricopeptide (TPR) repeat protein